MKTIKLLFAAAAALLFGSVAEATDTAYTAMIGGTTPVFNQAWWTRYAASGGAAVSARNEYYSRIRLGSTHTFSARLWNVGPEAGYAWYYRAYDEYDIEGKNHAYKINGELPFQRITGANTSSYSYTCVKNSSSSNTQRELWLVVYDKTTVTDDLASAPLDNYALKLKWDIVYFESTTDVERFVTITPDALKEMVIGVPQNQQIVVDGGSGFTSAGFDSSVLPAGLTGSFNSSRQTYTLSGTPTATGSRSAAFSWSSTTDGISYSKDYTLAVLAGARVHGYSPSASPLSMDIGGAQDFSVTLADEVPAICYKWYLSDGKGGFTEIPSATGKTYPYVHAGGSKTLKFAACSSVNGYEFCNKTWEIGTNPPRELKREPSASTSFRMKVGEKRDFTLEMINATSETRYAWEFVNSDGTEVLPLSASTETCSFTYGGVPGYVRVTVTHEGETIGYFKWQNISTASTIVSPSPASGDVRMVKDEEKEFSFSVAGAASYNVTWTFTDKDGKENTLATAGTSYKYTFDGTEGELKASISSSVDSDEYVWQIVTRLPAIGEYSPTQEPYECPLDFENKLTFYVIVNDATDDVAYQWYVSDKEGGFSEIKDATNYFYKYLRDGIAPIQLKVVVYSKANPLLVYDEHSWTLSTTVTPPTKKTQSPSGAYVEMEVGESKRFSVTLNRATRDTGCQWSTVNARGERTDIVGATDTFYDYVYDGKVSELTVTYFSKSAGTVYGSISWYPSTKSTGPTAPTIKGETTRAESMTVGEKKNFSVELNNPDKVDVAYYWSVDGTMKSNATSFSYEAKSAGTATVVCTVKSKDGKTEYGTVTWAIAVAAATPTVKDPTIKGETTRSDSMTVGEKKDLSVELENPDRVEVVYYWNFGDGTLALGESSFSYEPARAGSATVTCTVLSKDGKTTYGTVTWLIVVGEPAVAASLTRLSPVEESVTIKANVTTNFTVSAVGIDPSKLNWSWSKKPEVGEPGVPVYIKGLSAVADGASYSFMTPSAGSYTITCTAEDDEGGVLSVSWNLTVESAGRIFKLSTDRVVQKMSLAKGAFRQKVALVNGKAIKSMRILSSAPVVKKSVKSLSVKAATPGVAGITVSDDGYIEGEMTDDLAGEEIILEVTDVDDEVHTLTLKLATASEAKKDNAAPYLAEATPAENAVECYLGEGYLFTVDALDEEGDALTYVWYLDNVQQDAFFLHNGGRSCSFGDSDKAHEETVRVLSCFANDGVNGETLIKTWQIKLVDPEFAFKTTALPDGKVGDSAYFETVEYLDGNQIIEGGIRFYMPIGERLVSVEKTSGRLPPGMLIMAAEVKAAGVYGTYRNYGTYTFTLRATCSTGATAERTFTVNVTGARSAAKTWHIDPENTLAKAGGTGTTGGKPTGTGSTGTGSTGTGTTGGASGVENLYTSLLEALMCGMAEGDTVYLYPTPSTPQDSKGLALLNYIEGLNVIVTNGIHRVSVGGMYVPNVSGFSYANGGKLSFQPDWNNYNAWIAYQGVTLDYGTFIPLAFVGTDKAASDYGVLGCAQPYYYDAPSIDGNGYLGFRIGVRSDGKGGFALNFADDVTRRTALFSNTGFSGDLTVTSSKSALDATLEFADNVTVGNLTVEDGVKTVVKSGATLALQSGCEMNLVSGGIEFEAGSTLAITPSKGQSLLICNRSMTLPTSGKVTLRVNGSLENYTDLIIATRYIGPNDPTEKFDLVVPEDGQTYRLVLGPENTLVLTTKLANSDGDPGALNWDADDANLNTKAGTVKAYEPFSYTFGVTGSEAESGSGTGEGGGEGGGEGETKTPSIKEPTTESFAMAAGASTDLMVEVDNATDDVGYRWFTLSTSGSWMLKTTYTASTYSYRHPSTMTERSPAVQIKVEVYSKSLETVYGTKSWLISTTKATRSASAILSSTSVTTSGRADGSTGGAAGGTFVYSYELVGSAYSVTRTETSTFDADAGVQELLQGAYRVGGDAGFSFVDLGFAFPANGTYYSKLRVGSGGYLSLGDDYDVSVTFLEKGILPELNQTLDDIYIIRAAGSLGVRYGSFGTVTFYNDGTIRFAYGPDADLRSNQNEIPICRLSTKTAHQEYASKTGSFAGEGDAIFTPNSVPQGLSFDGATLSGTVNVPGDYTFTVKVTDVCGKTLNKTFSLHVDPADGAMPSITAATGPAEGADGNIHLALGASADFEAAVSSGASMRWTVDGVVQEVKDALSKFTLVAPLDRPLNAENARIHEVAVEATDAANRYNWAVRKVWYVIYNRVVNFAPTTYDASLLKYVLNGDEVILMPGTYNAPLDFGDNTAQVTVRGSDDPNATVVEIVSPNTRCFRQVQSMTVVGRTRPYEVIAMPCCNAQVSGIKFVGGNITSDTFDSKYNNNAGASVDYYGVAGGGAFGGSFSNCVFTGCEAADYGGGAYGAAMTHCVVEDCASAIGGGCANCELENCTIVYNGATSKAGGIDGQCSAVKCIVLGNTAAGAANDWDKTITPVHLDPYVPTLDDCFLTGDGDPKFCADYYLGVGSPAEGKGAHPVPSVTAKCYVDVQVVGAGTVEPFDPLVENGGSVMLSTKGRDVVSITVDGVAVAAANTYELKDVTANTTVVITFASGTITVGAGKDHATIAAAIANAGTGDTIEVYDGTYGPIDVSSFVGTLTIAAAANATPVIDGGNVGRCVIAKPDCGDVVLRGMTLVNGLAAHTGGEQVHPNGLQFANVPQLLALGVGGGVFGGAYENCVISNCVAQGAMGGGAFGAKLTNCALANNVAGRKDDNSYLFGAWGGGAYGGSLSDCRVNGNILRMAKPSAICSGAGTYDAEVRNSYVWGNVIDCGQYAGEEPSNSEAGERGLVIQTSDRVPTAARVESRKTPVSFGGTAKYATEAEAQTAAAKQTVEIPTSVARVIRDQDAYVAKFTMKTVQQKDGSYVNKPAIKEEVKEEIFETELATALTKDDAGNDRTEFNVQRMDRTLTTTTPGLYYALEFATSLGSDSNFNGERHLSTGGSVKLSATSIDSPSGFWRVNVYATPDGD